MFYPKLNRLKHYHIDKYFIDRLDVWLGSQKRFFYDSLNPNQFSLDMDINQEISIKIFLLCTAPDINLLKMRTEVSCPVCDAILNVDNSDMDGDYCYCNECNNKININENTISWFELLEDPENQEIINISPKKANPLRMSEAEKVTEGNEFLQRLLNNVNRREE